MNNKKSRIELIIDEINSNNAKKVALLLVIGFSVYHGILHLKYGTNSCRWLLSDGRYKGDQEWQPFGCMLHHYTKIDTRKCLRYLAYYGTETHFIFVGDKQMQNVYQTFVEHLVQTDKTTTDLPQNKMEKNQRHIDDEIKIKVEFVWAPLIDRQTIEKFRNWAKSNTPPSVIIVGAVLEAIRKSNASRFAVQEFKLNLTGLVQPIDQLHMKKSKVLWTLQSPIVPEKLKIDQQMLSNELIDLYNAATTEVLSYSSAELWLSYRLVGQGLIGKSTDGVVLTPKPLEHITQILLNMYCNDYMNFNDGTCCSSMEPYTTLQIVTYAILFVCVAIALFILIQRFVLKLRYNDYRPLMNGGNTDTSATDISRLFTALSRMALIMVYFFICDRTNFFMKENKYYSEFSFWLPIGYMTILGLFFTENSKYTRILHRDQLNEWKGWMQLVILVYHITDASHILTINMHIKVLISAYLFLLGYEQFFWMWHRSDQLNLIEFFRMLYRLNFMTILLCLCMNRPYQFYHFVPLLAFWYLMVYCCLIVPPYITAQTTENNLIYNFYLLIKFIILFSVITILFMSEVFFEKIFVTRPWKALFVTTDDDIHEWWSRWKLDRYSTLYGMCFAVIIILLQKSGLMDDNNHGNLFSRGIALSITLLAICGLLFYTVFTFLCRNELECMEIHSYIVFIPIVGYVILRNVSGVLRTRYSSLFAWFGEISLELFVSQYHIWLAADTHGVLVLLPDYPVLNMIITSYIFVCVSHEVHRLTMILLPYAVPSDWKSVLKNFILFLAILVPIGINDGMF